MKTIELFSGTKSFSKVMATHGHRTWKNPTRIIRGDTSPDAMNEEPTVNPHVPWKEQSRRSYLHELFVSAVFVGLPFFLAGILLTKLFL